MSVPGDSFSFRPKIELARKEGHIAGLKEAAAICQNEIERNTGSSFDPPHLRVFNAIHSRITSLQQEGK